jgi:hypothetical protein
VTAGVSAGARREDDQSGTQSFAAAADNVIRDLAHQNDLGIESFADDLVHRLQVCGNEIVYEVGCHVASLGTAKSKVRDGRKRKAEVSRIQSSLSESATGPVIRVRPSFHRLY